MIARLKMPKLSPTMQSGVIVKWYKKPGEAIAQGDLLFEVATDKATVEHHALDDGFLLCILTDEGAQATLGEVIALFGSDPKEDFQEEKQKVLEEKNPKKSASKDPQLEESSAGDDNESLPLAQSGPGLQQNHVPISDPIEGYRFDVATSDQSSQPSSPLAKQKAKELGVDLRVVKGTGPGGRIVSADVEKASATQSRSEVDLGFPLSLGGGKAPTKAPGSYSRQALSPMRSAIASSLQQSKTFIPHFYVKTCFDATDLLRVRQELKAIGLKVSVNDLFLRACAVALKAHPKINVGFDSATQELIQFETIDIAMAVSLEDGLITPILRHCDFKNLQQIAQESKELAQKARDSALQPHEYKGGSFTLSNLGMYGVSEFSAIINPPQGAILAVAAPQQRLKLERDKPVEYPEITLTLSCDHRIIDGGDAALFLKTLKDILLRPNTLLMI